MEQLFDMGFTDPKKNYKKVKKYKDDMNKIIMEL